MDEGAEEEGDPSGRRGPNLADMCLGVLSATRMPGVSGCERKDEVLGLVRLDERDCGKVVDILSIIKDFKSSTTWERSR